MLLKQRSPAECSCVSIRSTLGVNIWSTNHVEEWDTSLSHPQIEVVSYLLDPIFVIVGDKRVGMIKFQVRFVLSSLSIHL